MLSAAGSWFCTIFHHYEKSGTDQLNLWSLVIPRIATAVGIFYMNQYITDVPDELVEAARIDGCTDFGIFMKIILPVIKPAMASWCDTLIADGTTSFGHYFI